MQIKEIKREGLACHLEVTLPAADIDKHRESELLKIAKTVKMDGFRPGKVPMHMVKARYGRAVMGEVLEKAVNESSKKAMEDRGLKPALQPKIEVKEFDEGKDLVFTMAVETLPEVKVMDLKKISLEKPVAKVGAEIVDETLGRIAGQHGTPVDLDKPRASKKDDVLTMDFVGKTDEGLELPGMTATDFQIRIGSGSLIPGFEDQLIGLKEGAKADVKVTFPEDYHEHNLAGKPATFAVTVKKVQEFKAAAIDDDFAKKLGFEDVAALKKAAEHQISTDYGRASRMKVKRALLDTLDENHSFDLPQGMVDLEHQSIVRQMEAEAHAQAHAAGDHSHDDDHAHAHHSHLSDAEKEELRAIAERRVRLGLVLSEIGRANTITVNDGELQRALFTEASRYPGQEKQVLEFYRSNRGAIEQLRAPIFEEKVVDFILELAKVTEKEVSSQDLLTEDDDDFKPKAAKKAKSAAKKKADDGEEKPAAKKEPKKR